MSINEIPTNVEYQGYLWLSNSIEPIVFDNQTIDMKLKEKEIELKEGMMPFVVEGQLYSQTKQTSYSIKYVDGEHIVLKYDKVCIDDAKGDIELKTYLSNRMDDRALCFLRYWEPTEKGDENCEGMKPLVITKNVFVGFKNKEVLLWQQ